MQLARRPVASVDLPPSVVYAVYGAFGTAGRGHVLVVSCLVYPHLRAASPRLRPAVWPRAVQAGGAYKGTGRFVLLPLLQVVCRRQAGRAPRWTSRGKGGTLRGAR